MCQDVLKHFPTALSVDDYVTRVEIALAGYGFTGDNTIGVHIGEKGRAAL